MSFLLKIKKFLLDKDYRFMWFDAKGLLKFMTDETFLKRKFRILMKEDLNLENPQTFNEKLQWLKLYDHRPEYVTMVDKFAVKKYVADCIGAQYVIPTIASWDRFDDIDFDALPKQFVLKCTHDSGGLVIVKNKAQMDKSAAKKKIEESMKKNYFYSGREWPYKNIKPQIIAEKYVEDSKTSELRDYKFFSFNGEVKALFIATDRQKEGEETKFDFFDAEFNHLNFTNGHPNALVVPQKPERFEEMKLLAEKLSKDIPHVRVDFYEVDGRIYFGEITFYHWSGFVPFEPKEWDVILGSWINLPEKADSIK